ncbi:D-amino-acid transaminase [Hyphobacterium sp.]|uniref:D-amino-acid transaminase n=1 Tax=Hyphobacterium sp. TaxID=2004662 RepID=UPI003BAD7DA2
MSRFAYVNGRFIAHPHARIHIEDRGNQFADAVYEVWGVTKGQLMDFDGHLMRLARSLGELRIKSPMSNQALSAVLFRMIELNRLHSGLIYLQISRGQARRDHVFPGPQTRASVIMTAKATNAERIERKAREGIKVITQPDIRWGRRDIKTVSLLPNVLVRQAAAEAGAQEGWMIDDAGLVTEGSASNAWIVNAEGVLITRPADHDILNGITRRTIIALAAKEGIRTEERAFSLEEARLAQEAFVTSASTFATPVIEIDGQPVGNGHPGTFSLQLRESYVATAKERARGANVRRSPPLLARRRKHPVI